jgi:hypothetical protein
MARNIGTLITSPIRPNDSLDNIATALSNEIKGGIHSVNTYGERDLIIVERREWGMLCYIDFDKKTYQLKKGYVDSDILNNNNWVEFGTINNLDTDSEWRDPIIGFVSSLPLSPNDKDRYILTTNNNIIEYESGNNTWNYIQQKDGTSVRLIGEDNTIYKFSSSENNWIKERLNQVLYLTTTYSSNNYILSSSVLDTNIIYIVKFSNTNTSDNPTMNGLSIKYSNGKVLNNVTSGLISDSILYIVLYNGTNWEIQSNIEEDTEDVDIHFINKTDTIYRVSYGYTILSVEDFDNINPTFKLNTNSTTLPITVNPYDYLEIEVDGFGNIVLKTKIL